MILRGWSVLFVDWSLSGRSALNFRGGHGGTAASRFGDLSKSVGSLNRERLRPAVDQRVGRHGGISDNGQNEGVDEDQVFV
jgi:hypothetical protein